MIKLRKCFVFFLERRESVIEKLERLESVVEAVDEDREGEKKKFQLWKQPSFYILVWILVQGVSALSSLLKPLSMMAKSGNSTGFVE